METKRIRLGIIGCGGIMNGAHLSALIKLQEKDAFEITAVCDIVLDRAEKAAEAIGGNVKAYANYQDMADAVDAVSIVLPHDLHYEVGCYFAERGKHLLIEKPLCNSEEECVRLIKLAEKKGVVLMCEYPCRFNPCILELKRLLDSGEYGEAYHMSIWTEQWTDNKNAPWANTARLGGGQLFSHGCHYTDVLLWFMGEPLEGSHFGTNIGTPWMLKEGTSTLGMKFKSGATAMHYATWGAKGTKMGYDFQIFTTSGKVLDYDFGSNEIRVYYNAARWAEEDGDQTNYEDLNTNYRVVWTAPVENHNKNLYGVLSEFTDCIKTGREPFTSGRRALESLRVIWKVYDAEKHSMVADLSDIKAYQ